MSDRWVVHLTNNLRIVIDSAASLTQLESGEWADAAIIEQGLDGSEAEFPCRIKVNPDQITHTLLNP